MILIKAIDLGTVVCTSIIVDVAFGISVDSKLQDQSTIKYYIVGY